VSQDRPTSEELVVAVREFLETDVLEATDGRVQFHTRVAINALKIIERELADDGTTDDELRSRLADLLGHDASLAELTRELATAIRSGLDGDDVAAAVRASVRAKLDIANPAYLTDPGDDR
jgi:hypothetical protein